MLLRIFERILSTHAASAFVRAVASAKQPLIDLFLTAGVNVNAVGEQGRTPLLVATLGEEVVGLIATCLVPRMDEDRLSCRITDLVVAARHRRQGIGSALLRAAATRARSAGAGRLDLSTGDARSDAHAFYERLAFSDNARALTRRLDEA